MVQNGGSSDPIRKSGFSKQSAQRSGPYRYISELTSWKRSFGDPTHRIPGGISFRAEW